MRHDRNFQFDFLDRLKTFLDAFREGYFLCTQVLQNTKITDGVSCGSIVLQRNFVGIVWSS